MEPVMAVEVETPEEKMGDVMGDLNSRRGSILGMDDMSAGRKRFGRMFRWRRCSAIPRLCGR